MLEPAGGGPVGGLVMRNSETNRYPFWRLGVGQTASGYFLGRPPHISDSSAKGWAARVGFGSGRTLRIASARIRSALVVILILVGGPGTSWTGCPHASTN